MILYLDTSSLLKLLLDEPGSATIAALADAAEVLASSRIAYAEARAALARARRAQRLTETSHRAVVAAFEDLWTGFAAVEVTDPLVRQAGDLAEQHALRGFDAIHLASALVLQRQSSHSVSFSAWDETLMRAALVEGLAAT